MQSFTVPQFIDVEDKIIGPVTTRQFIIVLSAFIIIAIFYKIFDFSLFVTSGFIVLAISIVLAFVKINGRPFHFFILNVVQTFKKPKLRVWNKGFYLDNEYYKIDDSKIIEKNFNIPRKKYFAKSRLTELSLIVDTRGMYGGEDNKEIKISNA